VRTVHAKTVEYVQNNTLGAGTKEVHGITLITRYPSSSAYGGAGRNDLIFRQGGKEGIREYLPLAALSDNAGTDVGPDMYVRN
jgi:hypothetical protein